MLITPVFPIKGSLVGAAVSFVAGVAGASVALVVGVVGAIFVDVVATVVVVVCTIVGVSEVVAVVSLIEVFTAEPFCLKLNCHFTILL